jgi:hypothetical protein
MRFEPTIAVFARAKTVHALDSAATVIGHAYVCVYIFIYLSNPEIKAAISIEIPERLLILSRVRVSVTNKNGFWIG